MTRADTIRGLAARMAAAGGRRLTITEDSARMVAAALEAYADEISRPRQDYPVFTVDVWAPDGALFETLAWASNAIVARAAYTAAVAERSRYRVTLRQGIRIVAAHRPDDPPTSADP